METVFYDLISREDLKRGVSSRQVRLADGSLATVNDIDCFFPGTDFSTYASFPTASRAGRLYRRTDGRRGLWMDTGSLWMPLTPWVNVMEFGATGDGVTNDTTACQAAITALAATGGQVYFPPGTYLVGELAVPYAGVSQQLGIRLLGASVGGTYLRARANNQNIIHFSGNYGGVENMVLHGNGFSGVSALRVTPESESQTSTVVNQLYNTFRNLECYSCAEGVVLKAGPTVSGADSGCYYNHFYQVNAQFCTRCVWLREPADNGATAASGCNRNYFYGCRWGQGSCNVGVHIKAGSANVFTNCTVEGISSGSSPIATPTGYYFELNDGNTVVSTNRDNRLIGCGGETTTRYFNNSALYTQVYGWEANNGAVTNFGTADLSVFFSGNSGTQNQRLLDMVYAVVAESGYVTPAYNFAKDIAMRDVAHNGAGTRRPQIFDIMTAGSRDGCWRAYDLTGVGVMTNVTSFGHAACHRRHMSGMVSVHGRVIFRATAAATNVTILMPFKAHAAQYLTNAASLVGQRFVLSASTSGGNQVLHAVMEASGANTLLNVGIPSGNWDTAGNTNSVWFEVDYMSGEDDFVEP